MSTKTQKIIGWVLTGLIALAFIGSASMKLAGGTGAEEASEAMGLTAETIKLIAFVELISVALFIVPRTGLLGTLLLAAYLGGAIATHLEHQQPFFAPVILQGLVWIAAVLRFPELSRRFLGTKELA
ncbi:DoxX family protein [Salmonirosea aquatica]|uniref:DoxX family protein n=1 Tax=Salmonirosea aquatica TaxID=2654236 RepID=A0A7C9BIT3_9BACT|nr:DoxX family protein [Cytophagaceae bacterium SJW1-29]